MKGIMPTMHNPRARKKYNIFTIALMDVIQYYICICYSYIPLRVGYHCYYTSPR